MLQTFFDMHLERSLNSVFDLADTADPLALKTSNILEKALKGTPLSNILLFLNEF